MDVTVLQLGLFLSATFVAALVAGVTGFAFALIVIRVFRPSKRETLEDQAKLPLEDDHTPPHAG